MQRIGWGDWTLNADNLTLTHKDPVLEINLEEISDSATLLDWIMQVQDKTWATVMTVGQLVRALSEIFNPQANLCSGGRNKRLEEVVIVRDLVEHLVKRYKRESQSVPDLLDEPAGWTRTREIWREKGYGDE